jgi:hypothetical protein
MRKFGYILTFVSLMLLFGTVGNIEHNIMPLGEGMVHCIVYLALMVVGARIINKYEENENE